MSFYNVNFSGRKLGAIGSMQKFSVELKFNFQFDYKNSQQKRDAIRLFLSEFFQDIHELVFFVRMNFVDKSINQICTREMLGDRCRVYETDVEITLSKYRDLVLSNEGECLEFKKH
tara:strand:+ start:100 stop:447 length:348 start_codon:yes stop_codon:yes gene_type:complete